MAKGGWSGSKSTTGTEIINSLTANSTFELTCTAAGGDVKDVINVVVNAAAAPTVSLSANPGSVIINGSTSLTWSSTNANTCTASGSWSGGKSTSGSRTRSNLTSDKTYTLTCTGPGGTASDTASVTVFAPSAPIVNISASPTNVANGGSTTLSWDSSNVNSCTASGNWSGSRSTSGSLSRSNLTSNKTYTLTCTGAGGTASDSITVTVASPAPIVNISASPGNVANGGSTTLSWDSSNADSCTASGNWTGSKNTSGSEGKNNLTANRSYTLTCIGSGGTSSDTVNVTVAPPVPSVNISASPTNVANGGSTTLSWNSSNVDSCTASGNWSGSRSTSGSTSRNNLTSNKTYTLTCNGAGGTVIDTVSVTVDSQTPPAPTLSFSASPSTVAANGSTTLSWSSNDAGSCSASGNWSGSKGLVGSEVISAITTASQFTLVCNGSGGSVTKTVNVTLNPGNSACTHIVPNGTYSTSINSSSFPAGSVVCAETDGQVVYTGSFTPSGYDMKGFVINSNKEKDVGNGTFERMSFVGGPACGNTVNAGAGANTVIKDSVFYGKGGRYLFLAWQTSNITITNAIFRVDGGWGETNSCNEFEPNAALNFYDSHNMLCDGCINIDQKPTAASNSENLGGLGMNAHTSNLCYSVEIRNSVDFNASHFWAEGNGQCATLYNNLKGDMNFNLRGTATVVDSTGNTCNSWNGSVVSNNSDIASGNCASSGAGVALNLNTQFLDDPRWRNEMCGGFSNRTDGWCGTQMPLSAYISQ